MRGFILSTVLVSVCGFFFATYAQQKPQPPSGESDIARAFGALPRPGNLSDILACAGANEVFWTTTIKEDPRNPEAHEAKRKAGWYSAVALWVFQVDSLVVVEAVKSASEHARKSEVFDLARQCRKAPDSWRD